MNEQKYPLTVASLRGILAFAVLATIFATFLYLAAQTAGKIEAGFFAGTIGSLALVIVIIALVWWKERNKD